MRVEGVVPSEATRPDWCEEHQDRTTEGETTGSRMKRSENAGGGSRTLVSTLGRSHNSRYTTPAKIVNQLSLNYVT